MKTRIQKWGNSLAMRIPKVFANEVKLEHNSIVEISLEEGKITIVPVSNPLNLEELLAKVTEGNIHREVDTGGSVGREGW